MPARAAQSADLPSVHRGDGGDGPRAVVRRRVEVRGVVQGVGFRPFVYSLASELALSGEVWNTPDGVIAEVQGEQVDADGFCVRVRTDAPPLAQVEQVSWSELPVVAGSGFVISASRGGSGRTLVPADVATCAACLAELHDPADRRYRHPFITCTACGPRFTIVTGLPYDRPMTTMAGFPLCPDCAREYADPADRRFHAQPVSCHSCGPVLELVEPGAANLQREPALARARELLAAGAVVAVKGLGGYHLACDATNPVAVQRLRDRKRRGDKPFAVLVPDAATARRICRLDEAEEALLTSSRRPIVLLARRTEAAQDAGPGSADVSGLGDDDPGAAGGLGSGDDPGAAGGPGSADGLRVADEVAPGNPDLGVMLPPTALHHLLLGLPGDPPGPQVLVLTSGNLSSEPIVTDDAEAQRRLRGIADAWLRHDRPIHVPCDDSVVRVVAGRELPIRRSRGYAPMPVPLPVPVPPVLAVGGDLKNTFCVAQGRYAWLSAHVGDMDDLATQHAFTRAVNHLAGLVMVHPELAVADRHPAYRSAQWADRESRAQGWPLVRVQHHHAHVAAVMAEHGLDGSAPVIGIAMDGTGYGDDGAVWGGEVLLADYGGYQRYAHLSYVPLAGGDAAVRRPYRMALAHLAAAQVPWDEKLPCVAACPEAEREVLEHQLRTGLACVPTSSAGRLFDAIASLTGLCHEVGFEAQAAMALEAAARFALTEDAGVYPLPVRPAPQLAGVPAAAPYRLDAATLVQAAAQDVLSGVPAGVVAARFHRGLAAGIVDVACRAREGTGLGVVALSGGVFCNAVLLEAAAIGLAQAGFEVLSHRKVPPNDGGLALGQVMVAAARETRTQDLLDPGPGRGPDAGPGSGPDPDSSPDPDPSPGSGPDPDPGAPREAPAGTDARVRPAIGGVGPGGDRVAGGDDGPAVERSEEPAEDAAAARAADPAPGPAPDSAPDSSGSPVPGPAVDRPEGVPGGDRRPASDQRQAAVPGLGEGHPVGHDPVEHDEDATTGGEQGG